jgi:DNA-binding NarL/FixJ family response regulator
VDLASGHRKSGVDLLKKTLDTFRAHGYDWRAGQSALRLYAETRDATYAYLASEHLRNYMGCWLGDELRAAAAPVVRLPPMQKRVYEELRTGKSVAAIADKLGKSVFTIRNHIKTIYKAFGVNSRAELLVRGRP